MAFSGLFTPVLAKASTWSIRFSGSGSNPGNFEPDAAPGRVMAADSNRCSGEVDLLLAFVEGSLEAPKALLPEVYRLYFEPQYAEFSPRTMWSLSNALRSAFKALDPVPQFKATSKAGGISQSIACMTPAVPFTVLIPASGSAALRLPADLVRANFLYLSIPSVPRGGLKSESAARMNILTGLIHRHSEDTRKTAILAMSSTALDSDHRCRRS